MSDGSDGKFRAAPVKTRAGGCFGTYPPFFLHLPLWEEREDILLPLRVGGYTYTGGDTGLLSSHPPVESDRSDGKFRESVQLRSQLLKNRADAGYMYMSRQVACSRAQWCGISTHN